MAYLKNNAPLATAPLMYSLPTPVGMQPAMADDEIEMDPDYVGAGANPKVIGEKPPAPMDVAGALKAVAGSIASLFQPPQLATTAPPFVPPKPAISRTTKIVALAGAGALAFYFLRKR